MVSNFMGKFIISPNRLTSQGKTPNSYIYEIHILKVLRKIISYFVYYYLTTIQKLSVIMNNGQNLNNCDSWFKKYQSFLLSCSNYDVAYWLWSSHFCSQILSICLSTLSVHFFPFFLGGFLSSCQVQQWSSACYHSPPLLGMVNIFGPHYIPLSLFFLKIVSEIRDRKDCPDVLYPVVIPNVFEGTKFLCIFTELAGQATWKS